MVKKTELGYLFFILLLIKGDSYKLELNDLQSRINSQGQEYFVICISQEKNNQRGLRSGMSKARENPIPFSSPATSLIKKYLNLRNGVDCKYLYLKVTSEKVFKKTGQSYQAQRLGEKAI